jgi:hypothetical protein
VTDALESRKHCDKGVAFIHCTVLSLTWESVAELKSMNCGCNCEYGLIVSRITTVFRVYYFCTVT